MKSYRVFLCSKRRPLFKYREKENEHQPGKNYLTEMMLLTAKLRQTNFENYNNLGFFFERCVNLLQSKLNFMQWQ